MYPLPDAALDIQNTFTRCYLKPTTLEELSSKGFQMRKGINEEAQTNNSAVSFLFMPILLW